VFQGVPKFMLTMNGSESPIYIERSFSPLEDDYETCVLGTLKDGKSLSTHIFDEQEFCLEGDVFVI